MVVCLPHVEGRRSISTRRSPGSAARPGRAGGAGRHDPSRGRAGVRVHPNAVNRWIKRYREGGFQGLAERRRGRRPGEQPALSASQQEEVVALVRDATPDELGLAGFLWTRDAVAELIAQRYGLWLARTTVGAYLRGWGFSPQKPQHRALEQNPVAVARWLKEEFPAICAQARREGGVVLWLDEMGVRSDAAAGRSWAPVGQTPVIKRTGKRFRVNMLSAISNAGMLRFRLLWGPSTAPCSSTSWVGCCAIAAGG